MPLDHSFVKNSTELLTRIPSCVGDTARLVHRLNRALTKLDSIISAAKADFKKGKATYCLTQKEVAELDSE